MSFFNSSKRAGGEVEDKGPKLERGADNPGQSSQGYRNNDSQQGYKSYDQGGFHGQSQGASRNDNGFQPSKTVNSYNSQQQGDQGDSTKPNSRQFGFGK